MGSPCSRTAAERKHSRCCACVCVFPKGSSEKTVHVRESDGRLMCSVPLTQLEPVPFFLSLAESAPMPALCWRFLNVPFLPRVVLCAIPSAPHPSETAGKLSSTNLLHSASSAPVPSTPGQMAGVLSDGSVVLRCADGARLIHASVEGQLSSFRCDWWTWLLRALGSMCPFHYSSLWGKYPVHLLGRVALLLTP